MAKYSYACGNCGERRELQSDIGQVPPPPVHQCADGRDTMMRRDYRTDLPDFGNSVAIKREREFGGASAVRDLFLPTAKEMAGPNDPDGSKGIREWNERNEPRPGNKRPMRPEAPRKSF